MNAVRISGELIDTFFVAVHLGNGQHGLVEIGSAEVERDEQHYYVTASVLGEDGHTSRYAMPDAYQAGWQARRLADVLNSMSVCRNQTTA
jgi:hypothetical protein